MSRETCFLFKEISLRLPACALCYLACLACLPVSIPALMHTGACLMERMRLPTIKASALVPSLLQGGDDSPPWVAELTSSAHSVRPFPDWDLRAQHAMQVLQCCGELLQWGMPKLDVTAMPMLCKFYWQACSSGWETAQMLVCGVYHIIVSYAGSVTARLLMLSPIE